MKTPLKKEKNLAKPGKPLSQEAFLDLIKEAENGEFSSIEDSFKRLNEWRLKKFKQLKKIISIVILILSSYINAQDTTYINTTPQPATFSNYQNQSWLNPQNNMPNVPNALDLFRGNNEPSRINQQNQQIINEVEQNQKRQQETLKEIYQEAQKHNISINYNLPSFSHLKETSFYVETFKKMSNLDVENFSIKDVNFEIENAYYQNHQNKAEFDKTSKAQGNLS